MPALVSSIPTEIGGKSGAVATMISCPPILMMLANVSA
jgi:hypothetical protein